LHQRAEELGVLLPIDLLLNQTKSVAEVFAASSDNGNTGLCGNDCFENVEFFTSNSTELSRVFFLTGATGFLGLYILRRLLLEKESVVHVLVRAYSDQHARDRLRQACNEHELEMDWTPVKVHVGDLY
jgi:hypothetical protein